MITLPSTCMNQKICERAMKSYLNSFLCPLSFRSKCKSLFVRIQLQLILHQWTIDTLMRRGEIEVVQARPFSLPLRNEKVYYVHKNLPLKAYSREKRARLGVALAE